MTENGTVQGTAKNELNNTHTQVGTHEPARKIDIIIFVN